MISDLFFLSIKNLTHRKLRSYLTIIGILIGIAAVVALISLSEGMQKAIEQQFQEAGSNIIMVMSTSGGASSPMVSLFSTKPLTEKDLRAVENLRGEDKAGGVLMMPAMISVGKEKKNISTIILQSSECSIEEKTFNELLANTVLADLEKSEKETFAKDQTKALSKFDKILKSQDYLVKGLEKAEKENQEKGELIYTHYAKIELLLAEINKMRKTKSWKEIKEETKNIPFIKSVDEHKGTITLKLE